MLATCDCYHRNLKLVIFQFYVVDGADLRPGFHRPVSASSPRHKESSFRHPHDNLQIHFDGKPDLDDESMGGEEESEQVLVQ